VQAVAQANLNQPRYATTCEPTCVVCGCRVPADWTKTSAGGVATVICTRSAHRGTEDGMHEQTRRLNWGPTRGRSLRQTKQISCRRATSGSDEAIVSDDLGGQHNRLASQGPLDGSVGQPSPPLLRASAIGEGQPTWPPYKPSLRRRSAATSRLKPYWGKPAVRNFRGGRENTMIGVRLADA
jgi:hypothetical protein